MKALENKVIAGTNNILRIIPVTYYPIEYVNVYVKGIGLERKPRRKKIFEYIAQSLILYLSPLLILYYDSIIKLNLPDITVTQAKVLLILYIIIGIFNIIKMMGERHAIQF